MYFRIRLCHTIKMLSPLMYVNRYWNGLLKKIYCQVPFPFMDRNFGTIGSLLQYFRANKIYFFMIWMLCKWERFNSFTFFSLLLCKWIASCYSQSQCHFCLSLINRLNNYPNSTGFSFFPVKKTIQRCNILISPDRQF